MSVFCRLYRDKIIYGEYVNVCSIPGKLCALGGTCQQSSGRIRDADTGYAPWVGVLGKTSHDAPVAPVAGSLEAPRGGGCD